MKKLLIFIFVLLFPAAVFAVPGSPPGGVVQDGNTVKTSSNSPILPGVYTVGTLPTPVSANKGAIAIITDGDDNTDCTTGSGSSLVICQWTGSAWENAGDGQDTGSAEVSDADITSDVGDGDTTHAFSKDDLRDYIYLIDPDFDGATSNLDTDAVSAITEIAAALKSGADATIITGTAGTDTYTAVWNADGDLVDGYAPSSKQDTLTNEAGLYSALSDVSDFVQPAEVDVEMLADVTGEGTAATYPLFDDNDGTYSFRAIADGDVPDDITIDLATLATTLTISDNESTDEANAIIFTSGGDLDGGNLGIESDGDLNYNPSTGTVAATEFSGGGANLTSVDAATGDSATGFFDAGTIEHEYGGLEADVSAYAGLVGINSGSTSNITDAAGLETILSLGAYASDILGAADSDALVTLLGLVAGDIPDLSATYEAIDAEIVRADTVDTIIADWEWQDDIAMSFGNDNDWEIVYDETTSNRLEFIHTAGPDANVTWDLNDNAATSLFTITNSNATYVANLVVEGGIFQAGTQVQDQHAYLTDIISIPSPTVGDFMYFDGTDWIAFAPGTNGYFLQSQGDGVALTWAPGSTTGVNETYGSGWYADPNAPEKDDVYNYLHVIDTDDDGDVDNTQVTDSGDVSATWYLMIADGATGGQAMQSDSDLYFNPSTNVLHSGGGVTVVADDPFLSFIPSTASDSSCWIGLNHDSEGDDDDPFEIRQSETPGTNVNLSLLPASLIFGDGTDRDLVITFNNDDTDGTITRYADEKTWEFSNIIGIAPQSYDASDNDDTDFTIGTTGTSSIILMSGDNDSDNDSIDLQNPTRAGQIVRFYASANIDADDTITVDTTTDTTCTGCASVVLDEVGDSFECMALSTSLWNCYQLNEVP